MKKAIALGLVTAFLPAVGMSAGNHPMGGCGLGYLLMSNKDNEKVTQVLGATTNGTFGSQTFGISSGTSGCTADGTVKMARAAEVFAEVNLDSLRRDMAAGEGEYLNAFASLLVTREDQRPAMVQFLHTEYSALFPTAQTPSTEMLQALSSKLAERPELVG